MATVGGIDASIPLQAQPVDPMRSLASVVGLANGVQQVQQGQMANQQSAIALQERQGVQGVLSNIKQYQDSQGNVDFNKLMPDVMKVAPTTGADVIAHVFQAQTGATDAKRAVNSLDAESRQQVGALMYSLRGRPASEVAQTLEGFEKQYPNLQPYVRFAGRYIIGPATAGNPSASPGLDQALSTAARMALPAQTQQQMNTPEGVGVSTGQQTSVVSTKPDTTVAQGQALPGTAVQQQVGPGALEQIETDAQGNRFIVERTPSGAIVNTRPVPGGSASPQPGGRVTGPVNLPPNETATTRDQLLAERGAAQAATVNAPVMHDINRTIMQEADKGTITTGRAGSFIQSIGSRFGYKVGEEGATDYNVLGKMLERAALAAAQGMGPHTNAGLEAAVRANGSLDYTLPAIKKIASLNDALTTGQQLYSQGLERAIATSPNGVFAKRDFDQQWSKVFDPQVMRLRNAVDSGNQSEVREIVTQAGGPNSPGAQKLFQRLQAIHKLAGQ